MKIEEYLSTLPQSILSGEEIQIPPDTIREIFKFAEIGKNDTFYHLGSGNGISLKIARDDCLQRGAGRRRFDCLPESDRKSFEDCR